MKKNKKIIEFILIKLFIRIYMMKLYFVEKYAISFLSFLKFDLCSIKK